MAKALHDEFMSYGNDHKNLLDRIEHALRGIGTKDGVAMADALWRRMTR